MNQSTLGLVDGAQAPGLSLPLTAAGTAEPASALPEPGSPGAGSLSRPVFDDNAAIAAFTVIAAKASDAGRSASASAGIDQRALPGLDAWSLACRRKTLRGVWRGWLLKSHKSVR